MKLPFFKGTLNSLQTGFLLTVHIAQPTQGLAELSEPTCSVPIRKTGSEGWALRPLPGPLHCKLVLPSYAHALDPWGAHITEEQHLQDK